MKEQERRQSRIIAITAVLICALLLCSCGGTTDYVYKDDIGKYFR